MVIEFWETVKEYIPAKDKQTAADHVLTNLVDMGLDDITLKELEGLDSIMEQAVSEHLDDEDDWDEEEF